MASNSRSSSPAQHQPERHNSSAAPPTGEDQSSCRSCADLTGLVERQRVKLITIETSLRNLVAAHKAVCRERDLLVAKQTHREVTDSQAGPVERSRVAELEEKLDELSGLCGHLERDRSELRARKCTLEEANQQLTGQVKELLKFKSDHSVAPPHEATSNIKETSNRVTQTESPRAREMIHVDCQTCESLLLPATKRPPMELAIVAPTPRQDTDAVLSQNPETEGDGPPSLSPHSSDRLSSPGPIQADDDDNQSIYSESRQPGAADTARSTTSSANIHSGVSLFYVNELARKEMDLAGLRLRVRELEHSLRETKWKYNVDTFKLESRVKQLEGSTHHKHSGTGSTGTGVASGPSGLPPLLPSLPTAATGSGSSMTGSDRGSDAGAGGCEDPSPEADRSLNVTYIRNVLKKLLATKDKDQRKFMINALLAALETG